MPCPTGIDPRNSQQASATRIRYISRDKCVSTDPPYYDNIGYADLSDYFLRLASSLTEGCVPGPVRDLGRAEGGRASSHPGTVTAAKEAAEAFFLKGMTQAMGRLAEQAHPGFPVTIYYAFKQSETKGDSGKISTGWETFMDADDSIWIHYHWHVADAHRESARMIWKGKTNALASSIVLVCRRSTLPTHYRDAPRVRDRAPLRAAAGSPPPANRQRRPRRPRAGRHRSRHGGIHRLRQGARRRRQVRCQCARR